MQIYSKGKNIPTYAFGNLFTQGENVADTIYFIVDRYYGDNDLSECTFAITGVTEENWQVDQRLLPELLGDKIRLKWTVVSGFTHNSGMLRLELRASQTEGEGLVLKYILPPVYVRPAAAGKNGPLPETAEQAVSEINEATSDGLVQIQDKINSFDDEDIAPLAARIALLEERAAALESAAASLESAVSSLETVTASLAARPNISAVTQAAYDTMTPDENTLYVIVEEV